MFAWRATNRSRQPSVSRVGRALLAEGRAFESASTAVCMVLCATAWFAGSRSPSVVALCLVSAFVPYQILLTAVIPPGWLRVRVAVLAALVPGLCFCMSPIVLSDDIFRYAWDARVWLAGQNAYARTPSDPALSMLRDAGIFARINHPSLATIYPPVSQLLFVCFFAPFQSVASLKFGALLGHLSVVLLLPVAVRRLAPDAAPDLPVRAAWLFALNPLALSESALSGHIDVWAGLAVLGAALFVARGRWFCAGLALAIVSGVKLVGLFAAPTLWRKSAAAAVLSISLSALMVLPLLSSGAETGGARSGLAHFGQRWRGNDGGFSLLEWLAVPLVSAVASDAPRGGHSGLGPDEVTFEFFRSALAWRSQGVDAPGGLPDMVRKTPRDPTIVSRTQAHGLAARMLSILVVLGVALVVSRRSWLGPSALRWAVLGLLLVSPQVHPWYLLWLLPLELALGRQVVQIWSAVVLGSYASLDAWVAARLWFEPGWFRVLEYALVASAVLLEQRYAISAALTGRGGRNRVISP